MLENSDHSPKSISKSRSILSPAFAAAAAQHTTMFLKLQLKQEFKLL